MKLSNKNNSIVNSSWYSEIEKCRTCAPHTNLLDQVREVPRTGHYSIRTEQAYMKRIRYYTVFHVVQKKAGEEIDG